MQKIQTPNLLYEQVLCILKAVKVPYIDCHGHLIGDCTTCQGSGEGGGEIVTNSLGFNPSTNTISSVVNGVASSTEISLDAGDVVTNGSITISGVPYASGTSLQTIVTALAVSGPTAVTVSDTLEINMALTGQDISATLQQQGAALGDVLAWNGTRYAPVTLPAGTLPPGLTGSVLIHDGVDWQAAQPIEETQNSITGSNITLAAAPLSYGKFKLYVNGVRYRVTQDYTRVGTAVTLNIPIIIPASIVAEYFI